MVSTIVDCSLASWLSHASQVTKQADMLVYCVQIRPTALLAGGVFICKGGASIHRVVNGNMRYRV